MLELIGKKIGMSHIYKTNGANISVTLIKLLDNTLIEESELNGIKKIKIGFLRTENKKNINKSVIGYFVKKGIPVHKKLLECKIDGNLDVKPGDSIEINKLIKEGDKISVRGLTSGKGFAGVMKRWNFRGLEASHGVSVSHRSHGSTGQRQDPGKTFKGKKMAGHMGVNNITIKNLNIEYIDNENSVIAIKGSIPGKNGSEILVKLNNY